MAIVNKYQMLNCPPESEWSKHGGTLRQIADHLEMPDPCDYRPIRETLQRYLADEDVWRSKGGQGRKPKLAYGQFLISADCLRRGTGQEQAAHIVTAWRMNKGMPEKEAAVTRHAVRTAVEKLGGVCNRRGTTSTGSRDPESKWATSRDAQAQQWEGQVELPEETAALLAPGPKLTVEEAAPPRVSMRRRQARRGEWESALLRARSEREGAERVMRERACTVQAKRQFKRSRAEARRKFLISVVT